MRMERITCTAVLAAGACLAWSGAAWAHSALETEKAGELETLVTEANLVVQGEVASVEYVNAEVEGEGTIPHTLVTYSVKETLHGDAEGDSLTLRFIGGADGRGGFLSVTGVPAFQKGEEDILFVAGNGEDEDCPLVNCEYGRFRVDQNKVYNTHGQPVRGMKGNNTIARGKRAAKFQTFKFPAPKFDDLIKTDEAKAILKQKGMSVEQAREDYAKNAPKEIELMLDAPPATKAEDKAEKDPQDAKAKKEAKPGKGGPPETTVGTEAISRQSFASKITELAKKAKRKPAGVKSASKGPIKLKKATVSAAREAPKAEARIKQASAEDEAELQALEAQEFNPVLPAKK